MAASDTARAGAAAAVIATVAAIVAGTIIPHPDPHADGGPGSRHSYADDWGDAGAPTANTRCFWVSARASTQALAIFGLDMDAGADAGPLPYAYVRVRVCADALDGGVASLPPGFDAIDPTESADWPYDGGHSIEAWMVGAAGAPFDCACAPRAGTCKWVQPDGGQALAPQNLTLQPSQIVAGTGCTPKTCVELAGSSSMPAECQ